MKRKSVTVMLIILAILAVAAAFILLDRSSPSDIYPEDTFLDPQKKESTFEERGSFEKEFIRGNISPKLLDDETFYEYITEITDRLISIETSIAASRSDEKYDSNLQMNVKAYIDKGTLIKIDANDSTMRFEIYYWENQLIFILATPAEFAGKKSHDGSFIGYRMFFKENVMLQAMDLDGRPIDPDSPDFIEMEDFSSRLAFYFMQPYK